MSVDGTCYSAKDPNDRCGGVQFHGHSSYAQSQVLNAWNFSAVRNDQALGYQFEVPPELTRDCHTRTGDPLPQVYICFIVTKGASLEQGNKYMLSLFHLAPVACLVFS